MIGSPDLLAFTGTEGFGQDEDPLGLPEEFSVPLVAPCHPWSSSARFHRDFILVAEFSEQVGPTPVLTIPDDPRVIGPFDLNHFSVRIMSVDYQASGPGHTPPTSPGPRLNFSEDSRVVLGDSAEDAFAYVHHVTLYDLEARGMVRPFCMAYVCSDQVKLMENFCELSACFSQASDSLKTGNRQAFSMELQRKLQELEYTRLKLLQEVDPPPTGNGLTKADELEAVDRSIFTHRELLRQVTSYPNRKLKQPDFLPYDPADVLTDLFPPPEPRPPSSTSCSSEHHLKPLQELCNAYFLSLMKEQLARTEHRLCGDRSALRSAHVTRFLSKSLTLTNFLFELWSPEDGEDEEQERESSGATQSKSTEPPSLESLNSCVEEIPIKLVSGGPGKVTSDPPVETEMAGSVSSNDSIEVLGTEKSYQTQHVTAGSDSRGRPTCFTSPENTPVGVTDSSLRLAAADAGMRRVGVYARRANSEDSIEVLSTTESIVPDDLTAITEEEAEQQPPSGSVQGDSVQGDSVQGDSVQGDSVQGDSVQDDSVQDDSVQGDSVQDDSVQDDSDGQQQVQEDHGGSAQRTRLRSEVAEEEELDTQRPGKNHIHADNNPESSLSTLQVYHAGKSTWPWPSSPVLADADSHAATRSPLRLLSIDEASDGPSFTSSSDPPSTRHNSHSSTCSQKKQRRKAGLRALRFLKHNSFSKHALFCVLSGRPLVVIGRDENLVRKHVDALSLFLPAPGPDGKVVMPSLTVPLQLSDLLTWRLIGIHRLSSGSSSSVLHSLTRYSRYLALLDLDQKTLRSPSYSGVLIGRLADPHVGISRGATYLLHLESCLTALANQALLYTFSPTFVRASASAETRVAQGEDVPFTRGFCNSENDRSVMCFLSDLIKRRHAGRGPPVLRFSYSSVHLHRNTSAT